MQPDEFDHRCLIMLRVLIWFEVLLLLVTLLTSLN